MSNYRRLISYIYAYEGGIKGKNVGFAKLEVRNGQCKIQVNVRNVYIGSQDTGVYLLSGSEEILVGRIFIRNGAGEFRAVVSVGNVAGSGHTIDQCYGLTVHNLSDSWQSYTTIWEDAVAHAAEVALEEATSERVKREEPVKNNSVAEVVEAEIEAQSRQEETRQKEQGQSDLQDREEIPSSVIPPKEPEDKEILRPADMGVMEIRPMEVLPIGKELTAADLNEGTGEESPEPVPEQENPENVEESTKPVQEDTDSVQQEPKSTENESELPKEPDRRETNNMEKNSEAAQAEPEFMQNETEQAEQKPTEQKPEQVAAWMMPEQNSGPEEQASQTESPAIPIQEPGQQLRQRPKQQPEPQAGTHENSPAQPFRQNQWGQPGMLFPPNWFARPNRQSRPVQQTGQSMPGRQNQEMRTEQSGVPMQTDYEKSRAGVPIQPDNQRREPDTSIQPNNQRPESGTQTQPDFQRHEPDGQMGAEYEKNRPAGENQMKTSQTSQMAEAAAAAEPVAERPQNQGAILQSDLQPLPNKNNPQQASRQARPAGTIMPEQNMTEDEPKIDSVWQRFYKTYPKIQAFDYNGGCEIITIKPQDIGLLPRETWGYGNNSFLLHGYYNHRYLIFARLNNPKGQPRFLLGVPGHYYSNEKYMAAMFGFPNFVLSKVQPAGDDRFGYWYTDVRLGS